MASPKNWSRDAEAEFRKVPYVWNHIDSSLRLVIFKAPRSYWLELYDNAMPRANGDGPVEVIAEGSNKEDVRKLAIKWMRNHPKPKTNDFSM